MDFNLEYFKEDYDLLEHVALEESYQDQLNELITESDVMISIYESQRFIVESNTKIFDALGYGVVTEGVLGKVWEVIKTIIKKIGEMIKNFIGFFTGGNKESERKQEEKKVEQDTKKVLSEKPKLIKLQIEEKKYTAIKIDTSINIKGIVDFANKPIINDLLKQLDNSLAAFNNPTFVKTVLYSEPETDEEMEELMKKCGINVDPDKMEKMMEDLEDELAELDELVHKDGIEILDEKINLTEYAQTYMQKNIDFFKDYSFNEIKKALAVTQRIQDKFVKPFEKALDKISKEQGEIGREFASAVREEMVEFQKFMSLYIRSLMTIERAYTAHKHNISMASKELKK